MEKFTADELHRRLINRMNAIHRKPETCRGYSPAEKDIRLDELNYVLDVLDGYRVKKRPRLK